MLLSRMERLDIANFPHPLKKQRKAKFASFLTVLRRTLDSQANKSNPGFFT